MNRFTALVLAVLLVSGCRDVTEPERPTLTIGAQVTPAAVFTVTNVNADGAGSLWQAIADANASPGTDLIAFDIPGAGPHTIRPVALPIVTDPVVIDGYTQPGATPNTNGAGQGSNAVLTIELDGSNTIQGSRVDGLHITAGNSTVRGLVINRFDKAISFPLFRPAGIRLTTNGGNVIEGNWIGTDVTGTTKLLNTDGVFVDNVPGNRIGGSTPEAMNVISGNGSMGVYIVGSGSAGNLVQGNLIGTDASGTQALENNTGVLVARNATGNTIGGTAPGEGNVVSANRTVGVRISVSSDNLVQGNLIGTDVTGTIALGNVVGVSIVEAPGNTVGGTVPGAGNVISGNGGGIEIRSPTSQLNLVQGNLIGTDITGTAALGNGVPANVSTCSCGVFTDGSHTIIGGTTPGARNVISANALGGVVLLGEGIVFQGNFIGTDVTGTVNLGSGSFVGVRVLSGIGTTIGGTAAGAGNVIVGSGLSGVFIQQSTGVSVQGNFIGTDVTGTQAFGNGWDGITAIFSDGATIGGTAGGAPNTIAFNGVNGIRVVSGSGNSILSNSIWSNAGLGINHDEDGVFSTHDGVTPNDAGDGDTGANDLQNFPVLTAAGSCGPTTVIAGTLDSSPNEVFEVELFVSAIADPTGYGEGASLLGRVTVNTDVTGNATFEVTLPTGLASGQFVTATATNAAGSTSEFSQALAVVSLTPEQIIEGLRTAVEGLVQAGAFQDDQQSNGLLTKLDQAQISLANDRPNAVGLLNGLIAEVEGLVAGGVLTAEQGQSLTDGAHCAVSQLGD